MLHQLNQYAGLINIALFGTIIGFLIHISRISRTAIIDKYQAKTEALTQRIALMEAQEKSAKSNHDSIVQLLEKQLEFQRSIADLSENEKVQLIRVC